MFRRLEYKLLALIGLSVLLGLSTMVWFYASRQEANILQQNEKTMRRITDTIHEVLQGVMLTGNAGIAQTVSEHLQHVPQVEDLRILRIDGNEAFRDNRTIDEVNRRRGEEEFIPRDEEFIVPVLPAADRQLRQALDSNDVVIYYEASDNDENLLTLLTPMRNADDCQSCHGRSSKVRGLIKVTTSLAEARAEIADTRRQAVLILIASVMSVLLLTSVLLRRAIIRPIRRVTQAMQRAAKGDLTQQVPRYGNDEISSMAGSFNSMIGRLLQTYTGLQSEHDKLTTIILSAREGIVVTDRNGEVVLVNPAAEKLLGKSIAEIEDQGLLSLFDDAEIMALRLQQAEAGVHNSESIEYRGRQLDLHAGTIRSAETDIIGSAVMLRDVTAQKQLEQRLVQLSSTDGLTGLYNRRHLDEALNAELARALRYELDLSILMFDVDHFKRFNDEHGHKMGDKVLQVIADISRETVRRVDIPCRYGGEEFMLILPATGKEGALLVAERLRESIATARVDGLQVTISIGLASTPDPRVKTMQDFVALADAALYRAKDGGRNCVRIA